MSTGTTIINPTITHIMPSTRLEDADPLLAAAWVKIRAEYEAAHPGRSLIVTCTHRSVQEQQTLFRQGREIKDGKVIAVTPSKVVTYCDGVTNPSLHNRKPARALDFAVLVGGKVSWAEAEYEVVGRLARQHGLEWGGDWKRFKDRPHVQLPTHST